jgi:hypothetical protein
MKRTALMVAILCASVTLANNREWKDAKVTRIDSSSDDNGVVVGTVGTTVVGGRIRSESTFYWIETADTTYILSQMFNPARNWRRPKPLNVTLNGKTKIAIDGTDAYILDDAGKDVKLPIARKIARTPAEDPGKEPRTAARHSSRSGRFQLSA